MAKVFVSYRHHDGPWVWGRLVPCLTAGGAEVLIDRNEFAAGKAVVGQMDTVQDQADHHVLVLSPDYLQSRFCQHEMNRAIKRDPSFTTGAVIPVLRRACSPPTSITRPNPLYVDLTDDAPAEPWDALLAACRADLGADAPHWLEVRDQVARWLRDRYTVNLLVSGTQAKWRALVDHLADDQIKDLVRVDLHDPYTRQRPGLVAAMLGGDAAAAGAPDDLSYFKKVLEDRPSLTRVALTHFDHSAQREYEADFYLTLRHLIRDVRKLVLLVVSRKPFPHLVPPRYQVDLSALDMKTIELKGRS